jgi:hypothetical protein
VISRLLGFLDQPVISFARGIRCGGGGSGTTTTAAAAAAATDAAAAATTTNNNYNSSNGSNNNSSNLAVRSSPTMTIALERCFTD